MGIDLSKFKVVYSEKVLNAVALLDIEFKNNTLHEDLVQKPKFITVLVVNEDGNLVAYRDEAWMFQFLPIVGNERG